MDWKEFNTQLRNIIINISSIYDGETGLKTTILKSLSGNQGLSTMIKWIDTTNPDKIYNLGIKPLTKIADSMGYNLHLVFVPKEGENVPTIEQYLTSLNISFMNITKQLIHNMINKINYNEIKYPTSNKVSKVVQKVMDSIDYDNF